MLSPNVTQNGIICIRDDWYDLYHHYDSVPIEQNANVSSEPGVLDRINQVANVAYAAGQNVYDSRYTIARRAAGAARTGAKIVALVCAVQGNGYGIAIAESAANVMERVESHLDPPTQ